MTERAIVTADERDALTEWIELEGIPTMIVDTAGIREVQDHLAERLGVEKSLQYLGDSDVVLFVVDGGRRFETKKTGEFGERFVSCAAYWSSTRRICRAGPKSRRKSGFRCAGQVAISVLEGTNLHDLRRQILSAGCLESQFEQERVISPI